MAANWSEQAKAQGKDSNLPNYRLRFLFRPTMNQQLARYSRAQLEMDGACPLFSPDRKTSLLKRMNCGSALSRCSILAP